MILMPASSIWGEKYIYTNVLQWISSIDSYLKKFYIFCLCYFTVAFYIYRSILRNLMFSILETLQIASLTISFLNYIVFFLLK